MMMNSIDKIRQLFKGFLRPNYFEVLIDPPQKLEGDKNTELLTFAVNSTSFPFETINVQEYNEMSRHYKIADSVDYDPVAISFRLDSEGKVLDFFHRWRRLIVNDNFKVGYYNDYIGKVIIRLLDAKLQNIFEVVMHEVFPVNRNPMPLSYDTGDAIAELDVSFQFLYTTYTSYGQQYGLFIDDVGLDDIARIYQDSRPYGVLSDDYFMSGAGTFKDALDNAIKKGKQQIQTMVTDALKNPFTKSVGGIGSMTSDALQNPFTKSVGGIGSMTSDALQNPFTKSVGGIQTTLSGILNSQFTKIDQTLKTGIETKVSQVQSSITKKYQEIQKKAISRIEQGVKNVVSKIFKF
jgi:hypothetical protein